MTEAELPIDSPISRYMTRSPISIDADAGILEAAALMRLNGFQHLPVTRAGELVGVVSGRDLLALSAVRGSGAEELRVGDLARTELYRTSPNAALADVLSEMAKRTIGSAVVAEGAEIVGIFTATDALRVFAELLPRIREG